MGQMKPALRWYLLGVIAAGFVGVAAALAVDPPAPTGHDAALVALIASFSALAFLAPVKHAPKRQFVFYTSLQTVAILTLSPGEAAVACALGGVLGNVHMRRPWFNTLFNAAQNALTVLSAGIVYRWLAPVSLADPGRDVRSVLALVPAGALLYLVTATAVECATAIQRNSLPFRNFLAVRGPTLLPHVALVAVGAATAPAVNEQPWLILVAVAPILLLRSVMRASLEFDEATIGTVEELAAAVDLRHPALGGRSRRIAELAERLARAQGQPEEVCSRVALAARLHDVALFTAPPAAGGRVGEGRPFLHLHAEAGAGYVGRILRLPAIEESLRHHHDRYDGGGRPSDGGENLPLESRIIAVAEAWVELTRPDPPGRLSAPSRRCS